MPAPAATQSEQGGAQRVVLDDSLAVSSDILPNLPALDDALKGLEAGDTRKTQIVELRFFGGLSVEETAQVLKVKSP